jgi:RNA polymerase-interacting CarD/CdnL/TRCF family regulator
VFFEREGLTLMLREKDLEKTVRKPISANKAKKLLEHIGGWDGKVKKEWKSRANANQVAMEGGDPFAYADVYKGLSKLEAEGSLRATDREHMKKSLTLLIEEVSCALGETPEQARDQITHN